jgi:hypothetical protein
MIRAAATLGRELGLTVAAEGVETSAAWAEVRRAGCHVVQGYLCSPPLPVAAFEGWLAARSARPRPTDRPPQALRAGRGRSAAHADRHRRARRHLRPACGALADHGPDRLARAIGNGLLGHRQAGRQQGGACRGGARARHVRNRHERNGRRRRGFGRRGSRWRRRRAVTASPAHAVQRLAPALPRLGDLRLGQPRGSDEELRAVGATLGPDSLGDLTGIAA